MSIENTLAERGNRYGDFTDHADLAQGIQFRMQKFCLKADNADGFIEPWKDRLNNVQRQALTVIADKIARILSGDPNYADNWHDIQGYAKLVEDRLPKPGFDWSGALAEQDALPIDHDDVDIFDTDEDSTGTLLLNPENWEAGDVLVCVVQGDSVRYGEKYVYTGDSDDVNEYMVEVQPLDGGRVLAGQRYANRFRFHSRPTK